jgi:hypothetical protein
VSIEALEDRCLLTLNPAVNYLVGSSPLDVVARDFNGDGKLDLVTINSGQLSVLHGNGDGTFQAAQTTSVGSGLRAVAAGNFNSDTRPDLAITSSVTRWTGSAYVTEGFVYLLLNNGNDASGNVTFQAARSFSTGTNTTPGAVAVGDLNGDGKDDVAAAQAGGSNVSLLQGDGSGNLKTARHFAVGSNPVSVAVGDLDGGGRLDLVTANRGSGNVSVLLNNGNDGSGNATFQAARNTAASGTPQSVAVGDFNPGGLLDLAVTSNVTTLTGWGYWGPYYQTDGYVDVLLGHGDGSFDTARSTWVNTGEVGDLTTADFNGDNKLDVVAADGITQPRVDPNVLLGRGDGTFDAPYHFDGGSGPIAVAVGRLNADTATDLAVANFYSSDVSVFLNDANWPPLGAPFVSVSGVTVTEGSTGTTTARFIVSLSAASDQPITVDYRTGDGTATAGSDYQAKSGTVTIPAGQTSQTVDVVVYGDRVFEPDSESFSLTLSNPVNARMGNGTAWVNIQDDEPRISITGVTLTEGNLGTKEAEFTVSLASAYDVDVTVGYATADGSAAAGSDYQAKSGTVTIPAGQTSQPVKVLIYGDRVTEQTEYTYYDWYWGYSYSVFDDSEYFSVNLTSSDQGTIVNGQGVGTIFDDEPRISISGASVTEGNGGTTQAASAASLASAYTEAVFTVSLSRAYDVDVTVAFSTADGSAAAGSDYQAKSGTVTIPAGQTSQPVKVLVYGDRVAEQTEYTSYDWYWGTTYTYFDDREYFNVNLTSSDQGTIVNGQGVGTILDDEPRISISGATVTEGDSGTTEAVFTVSLTQAYDVDVTVTFATADGSATAGSDYQAKSGTVTIPAGQTSRTLKVVVNGDRLAEGYGESFYVNLTGTNYGVITNGQAVGNILDDEPRVYISDVYKYEGNSGTTLFTFAVTLSAAYDQDVTVAFKTVDGTATAGSDYQAQSGTLTIKAGTTVGYINVVVYGDTSNEANEMFSVKLSGAPSYAQISYDTALAYIYNDDTSPGNRGRKKK